MSEDIKRIEAKIDRIGESLTEIKVVQSAQAKDIQHHIQRTDLLEGEVKTTKSDVKELTKFRYMWAGALAVLTVIGGGVLQLIVKLLLH